MRLTGRRHAAVSAAVLLLGRAHPQAHAVLRLAGQHLTPDKQRFIVIFTFCNETYIKMLLDLYIIHTYTYTYTGICKQTSMPNASPTVS